MDYKQFCTDFEKRYGDRPESLFFSGLPITFFSSQGKTVGIGATIGAAAGVRKREDGRLVVGFSDSNETVSCNTADFYTHRDNKIVELMLWAEKNGVSIGGADILIRYNTKLVHPFENAMLTALSGFCENVPPNNSILLRRENAGGSILSAASRKDCITLFDGQRIRYVPFPEEKYKIVLCRIDEKNFAHTSRRTYTGDAADYLLSGEINEFCRALNGETLLRLKKHSATRRLFVLGMEEGTMLAGGTLPGGGIFSVVESDKVDTFIGEMKRGSEKVGDTPEFYVTSSAECGSVAIPKE